MTAVDQAAGVTVTPKAVEKIRQAFTRMGVADLEEQRTRQRFARRRLHGLELTIQVRHRSRAPTDNIFDLRQRAIFIDPKSILYLRRASCSITRRIALMQSGFVFDNPNAKKNCGCGTSFSA